MREHAKPRAFTIIELLVVVSIIALLVGLLLPAVGRARDQGLVALSEANMRQLGIAHAVYASAWNDRQYTLIDDTISGYGAEAGIAFDNYHEVRGGCGGEEAPGCHAPVILGWREGALWGMFIQYPTNYDKVQPIVFDTGFGAFRIPNAGQFNQYLNGHFYDPVFYAPKDRVVTNFVEPALENPAQYTIGAITLDGIGWSSYCLSSAAMFTPDVMSVNTDTGLAYTDPWSLPAGFRSPSLSHARYPTLKTQMIEHHWLQPSPRAHCNPSGGSSTVVFESCNTGHCVSVVHDSYEDCEPYYFNAAYESVPVTLFYDGHVEGLGTRQAVRSDARVMEQSGHGLWSRDTPFGEDGYFSQNAYDWTTTSFHILTMDGIRGRDKVDG